MADDKAKLENWLAAADVAGKFQQELAGSKELIDSMDDSAKGLTDALKQIAKETEHISTENSDLARQQAKAGRDVLRVLQRQQKGDTVMTRLSKTRLGFNRGLNEGEDAITDNLYAQYDAAEQITKEKKKQQRIEQQNANAQKAVDKATGGTLGKTQGITDALGIGGKTLKRMVVGFGVLSFATGVIYGTFKTLFNTMKKFADKVTAMGQTFGVIGTQSGVLRDTLIDADFEVAALGKNLKDDVLPTTVALASNFGLTLQQAADMSNEVLDSAMAMGLSNEQGAQLYGTLVGMVGLSMDQAEHLSEATYQLAVANKVNPADVMRDMADSSELIAKFGAENLASISKAAVQARMMGLNLKTVERISSSLLDFQSSINAEVEASVLIGKQLNFQRARELALSGDMSGMMGAVLDQLGGIHKFNRLNVIQRQSLARSLGIEVVEMNKLARGTRGLETPKSFMDMLGKDSQDALLQIVNKIKQLGVLFVNELGPHIYEAAVALQNFMEENKLFEWAQGMVRDFSSYFEGMGEKLDEILTNLAKKWNNFRQSISDAFDTVKRFAFYMGLGALAGGPVGAGIGMATAAITDSMARAEKAAERAKDAANESKENSGGIFSSLHQAGVSKIETNRTEAQDFMSRPGQPLERFSSSDTLIGVKGKIADMEPIVRQLEKLNEKTENLAKQIGTRVGDEIKNYA